MSNKIKKFTDDGWGLWIDGDRTSTLYLNEWVNPRSKSYVDISTRVYDAKNVKKVNYFIPFHIDENELTDLSDMLGDNSILQALFNTNGNVDSEKNKFTSELSYDGRCVSLINISREFTDIRTVEYGTVVSFDFEYIKEYITADEAYIIFRIPHKTLNAIFGLKKEVSGAFERFIELVQSPVISENFGYSVRINEARRLPQELNKIAILQQQRIKKALVTITIPEDYEVNDSACYRIRFLEDDLMKNYIPEKFPHEAITYQWVEEKSDKQKSHYNFYFKFARSIVNKTSVLIYFFLLFLVGLLGSFLWDFIKYIFNIPL